MDVADFKSILASVRPARIAVMIDQNDPDWQTVCHGVIEFLSGTWGGEHALIVPTDGTVITPLFWNLLESFDPDYICRYIKTGIDVRRANPDDFAATLEREIQNHIREHATVDDSTEAVRNSIEKALESSICVTNWGISPELELELKGRLAPFFFEQMSAQHSIRARAKVSYPFTPLSTILPNCAHPTGLMRLTSSDPDVPQLWIEAVTGTRHEDLDAALTMQGVSCQSIDFPTDELADLFRFVMTGDVGFQHRATPAMVANWDNPSPHAPSPSTPFRFSMVCVKSYISTKERLFETPIIVVIGSTFADFALYFNLSRLKPYVHWMLPAWIETKCADYFQYNLWSAATTAATRNIVFTSASLQKDEIEAAIVALDTSAPPLGKIGARASVLEDLAPLLAYTLAAFNTDNFAVANTQQVLEGKGVGLFPTPKPKGFATIVPYAHRWITELVAEEHTYPRHPALGRWLVQDARLTTDQVRVGSQGICYECPNAAYFGGGDVDTILIRPRLYIPGAEEVFRYLAGEKGWTTKVSDKGFFSRDMTQKLGGLKSSGKLLRNKRSKAILWQYLQPKPGDSEPKATDALFLASDRRWYFTLGNIIRHFEDDATGAVSFLDSLLDRRILHRGSILKCEFCRAADWFLLAELTDGFRCKRCRRDQRINSKHTLRQPEPVWYYQLDEVTYQGLRNDMDVPLLTLDYLRKKANSFLYTDELEIRRSKEDEKPFIEIDLCCISDGLLTIGEAKTANRIERGGKKEKQVLYSYREIALGLGAQQFVLSTSADWAEETLKNALKVFQDTRVKLIMLTGPDILS